MPSYWYRLWISISTWIIFSAAWNSNTWKFVRFIRMTPFQKCNINALLKHTKKEITGFVLTLYVLNPNLKPICGDCLVSSVKFYFLVRLTRKMYLQECIGKWKSHVTGYHHFGSRSLCSNYNWSICSLRGSLQYALVQCGCFHLATQRYVLYKRISQCKKEKRKPWLLYVNNKPSVTHPKRLGNQSGRVFGIRKKIACYNLFANTVPFVDRFSNWA